MGEPTEWRMVRTSGDLPDGHWMKRQINGDESLRPYAEDEAVSMILRVVLDAIERSGMSRADVAATLGTTKSYVSQVLNGSSNVTLKTLGAFLWAAGQQVAELRIEPVGGSGEQRGAMALADDPAAVSR